MKSARKKETDEDRARRRKHAKAQRDANREAGRCLDESKFKKHRKPAAGMARCAACRKKHKR